MLKYVDYDIVFREIPDETTLAINISGCPCHCPGCHSSYLADDIGDPLCYDSVSKLITENPGITCVSFMGGDSDHESVNDLARFIRSKFPELKVAWYSGRDSVSNKIDLSNFDFIKIGPYIEELGGLDKITTNQVMYKVTDDESLLDITSSMRDLP